MTNGIPNINCTNEIIYPRGTNDSIGINRNTMLPSCACVLMMLIGINGMMILPIISKIRVFY